MECTGNKIEYVLYGGGMHRLVYGSVHRLYTFTAMEEFHVQFDVDFNNLLTVIEQRVNCVGGANAGGTQCQPLFRYCIFGRMHATVETNKEKYMYCNEEEQ